MKKLKSIILIFENGDSMEIPAKYIRNLYIKRASDIIEQVYYTGKEQGVEVNTYKSKEEIYFIIRESKTLTYKPFDFLDSQTVFDRITEFPDITYITLAYSDESRQMIPVPYEAEYNDDNKYQSVTYINGFDDLVINIKAGDNEN